MSQNLKEILRVSLPYLQALELNEDEKKFNTQIKVLRLDKMNIITGGNKWFKLKYNLQEAMKKGYKKVLTFGGAHSNHIYALAGAGKLLGLQTIGVIRGMEINNPTDTLIAAKQMGMELFTVSRTAYSEIVKDIHHFRNENFSDVYVIPEGGDNELGLKGCEEIAQFIPEDTTHVFVSCGTGTTISGILNRIHKNCFVIGISALKGEDMLTGKIEQATGKSKKHFEIKFDYHFGGYAKVSDELLKFKNQFEKRFNIPLDRVYNSKMFYAVFHMLNQNYFPENSKIVAVHTGGLREVINIF